MGALPHYVAYVIAAQEYIKLTYSADGDLKGKIWECSMFLSPLR